MISHLRISLWGGEAGAQMSERGPHTEDGPHLLAAAFLQCHDCHPVVLAVPSHVSQPLWQVVANAVAALSEIAESHPSSNLLDLNPQSINKLLTALNECTEWGQIFILDCLANYMPKDDREAQR